MTSATFPGAQGLSISRDAAVSTVISRSRSSRASTPVRVSTAAVVAARERGQPTRQERPLGRTD